MKLPAGGLVLYPSTSLHHVTEITSGERTASIVWLQSMVRDDPSAASCSSWIVPFRLFPPNAVRRCDLRQAE